MHFVLLVTYTCTKKMLLRYVVDGNVLKPHIIILYSSILQRSVEE